MIKNYFLITFRYFLRQKVYSAINVFGMTVGLTSALLLILYIVDELSFDRFHPDVERIYRTHFSAKLGDQELETIYSGLPMAAALKKDVPAVASTMRLTPWPTIPVRYETQSFTERRLLVADSNFFNFFQFPLVEGDAASVLRGPGKIVITESTAKKYFGYEGKGDLSPIGKTFHIGSNGETKAEVTGIAQDPPHNSHLQFDFLLSFDTHEPNPGDEIWTNASVVTYFKLVPNATIESVNQQYDYFVQTYVAKELERFLQMDMKHFISSGNYVRFYSQPLTDIHLHSQLRDELTPGGNIKYLYLFGLIALFIIILACINFMNLSTARAANRAKEVGIRKTIGAFRYKLIAQFLMESYVYTIVAVILSLFLISISLNSFNLITAKNIQFSALVSAPFVVGLLLFIVFIGFFAGSYPAFYLTAFRPVEVLKGKVRSGMRSAGIRNTLVVFQFFISIGLTIATLTVYQQLLFVQKKNLGFDKENVLGILHTLKLEKTGAAFKNELKQHPEVVQASYSNRLPPNIDWNSSFRLLDSGQEHLLSIYVLDYDGLETMGLQLAAGRFFSRDIKADSAHVLVNEAAMRQFGWQTFEGKKLLSRFSTETGQEVEVIGVIKNFNFESLKNAIRPIVIFLGPEPNFEMAIRLSKGDKQKQLAVIEQLWKKYAPDAPFEYSFLDDNFNATFRAEQRMGQVFILFTGLAIAIACLGLFGLATFAAEQRSKEISIRKALGAQVNQLIFLMTKDFARLVLIAFAIAIPVTWYALEKWWLESFAYRTSVSVTVIVVAGVSGLLVALLTISVQSIRAATTNPATNLKSE